MLAFKVLIFLALGQFNFVNTIFGGVWLCPKIDVVSNFKFSQFIGDYQTVARITTDTDKPLTCERFIFRATSNPKVHTVVRTVVDVLIQVIINSVLTVLTFYIVGLFVKSTCNKTVLNGTATQCEDCGESEYITDYGAGKYRISVVYHNDTIRVAIICGGTFVFCFPKTAGNIVTRTDNRTGYDLDALPIYLPLANVTRIFCDKCFEDTGNCTAPCNV